MIRLRRAAALLLAALLMLLLPACGEEDPNAGRYLCTRVTVGEDQVRPEELYNGPVSLELRTGGGGRLILGENTGDIRWMLEGEALTVDVNGTHSRGSLTDGVITLDLMNEGVVLTLPREELAAALPTPTPQPELLASCVGDYYGWWEIENSAGAMPDTWYDCCAFAVVTKEGLLLTLWDEGTSRDEPMGVIPFGSDGEKLISAGGWFWYDRPEEGESLAERTDDGLELSGRHEGEGESFDFRIHLRPWGAEWDDPDARPYSYRFWYLPLIEAGEPMPDTIPTGPGESE